MGFLLFFFTSGSEGACETTPTLLNYVVHSADEKFHAPFNVQQKQNEQLVEIIIVMTKSP